MNNWQSAAPRARIGLAAAALSVVTLTAAVVLPARLALDAAPPATAAAPHAPAEVAIVPARIDVIGVREPDVAWALGGPSQPCRPAT